MLEKMKKGDKILVVNAFVTGGEYQNGDVLTVTDWNGAFGYTWCGAAMLSKSEYVPIPEEIKDWSIEEIKLYLAL